VYSLSMKTKLLIFGITGDLSTRKLLPALHKIVQVADFEGLQIIGVSRRDVNVGQLIKTSTDSGQLAGRTTIFSMDLAQAGDYHELKKYINLQADEQLLVYLSVPPNAATQIVDFLGAAGINTPSTKLLFEKPFGVDLASATEMIESTSRYYAEEQIYRIDHYLAKEMAQNIVAFRGGNALFSHLWNNTAIEKIEVIASESIGIEGRGQFYEQTGALRDVVQGHLMQLLALILMDIPESFDWNMLPDMRLKALQQLIAADPQQTKRAQYEGYQQEVGNPGSLTETFVSLRLLSMDPRWQNVPMMLVTGKALGKKTTEIRVHFRKFHEAQSNCLTFRIQPNEGVEIELYVKRPGYEQAFEMQKLQFNYPADRTWPDAYEHVIVDAIRSKKSFFTGSEEVLRAWEILAPLQDVWMMDDSSLVTYAAGSAVETIAP
jgi:glucose-6-phosphate 1-dehydrogenase